MEVETREARAHRLLLQAMPGKHKFGFGTLVSTPGALKAVADSGDDLMVLLGRHASGDWGELCQEDWKLNDWAVESGEDRILSSYKLSSGKVVWVITEGDRSATTLLLPEEY